MVRRVKTGNLYLAGSFKTKTAAKGAAKKLRSASKNSMLKVSTRIDDRGRGKQSQNYRYLLYAKNTRRK